MGWLRQSQFSCNTCNTSGDRTSAIVGKCPDWNGLSVKLGGLLLFPEPEPEPEPELQPEEPEDVAAILLPLSLALLLRPPSIDWFKLPIKGFLKGLEGLVSVKKISMFRNNNHDLTRFNIKIWGLIYSRENAGAWIQKYNLNRYLVRLSDSALDKVHLFLKQCFCDLQLTQFSCTFTKPFRWYQLRLKGLVKIPPNWVNWRSCKPCFKN